MTWGNFGAASGAQPTAGQPTGVQPFAPGQVGQPPGQGGATLPPAFNAGFESVMAAVSRGEISLNQVVANNSYFGGNAASIQAAQGNPTLMQAISQGPSQNGTNGLNGVGAGGGTVNASYASNNTSPGTFDAGFDSTAVIDPKQVINSGSVSLLSPIQYGGS
ncbi:MAG TPA: hypothetical protein VNZ53_19335 [Steroidobacteraceae bacterium]|jgi:hypothetical protein|nr:hypothetical protein [Steroidobacteraceae bacterium]